MIKRLFPFSALVLILMAAGAAAGSSYDNVYAEYPKDKYLIGIGETGKTGNDFNDRRVAEVMARLEIAKQIKVRLREETVDIMCEGGSSKIFRDRQECRNVFVMVVEVTVDEFLQGSRITDHGEKDNIVYAIAVMPKAQAVENLNSRVDESVTAFRENIEKAKQGDKKALDEAQDEYVKAVAYDKEREMLDGVKSRASVMFDDLEKELVKLKGNDHGAK